MARNRDDILSVSIGPDLISLLKQEAQRREESVSKVVASWANSLKEAGDDAEHKG